MRERARDASELRRPAPPRRPAAAAPPAPDVAQALALQRSAGNAATGALLQRWIKLHPSNERVDAGAFEDEQALAKKVDAEYVRWRRAKKITTETGDSIKATVRGWIKDDKEHAKDGKHFMSWGSVFDMARAQVSEPATAQPAPATETPDPAPLTPPNTPSTAEELKDVVLRLRRAASELRETGLPPVPDDAPPEKKERGLKRTREWEERVLPNMQVPYTRRAQDARTAVPHAPLRFTFGPLQLEIQGGRSHRMTPQGGGSAPPYSTVIASLKLAAQLDDAALAGHIRTILEEGTVPAELPAAAHRHVLDLLAILYGPEMSRSSTALPAFVAAMHWVAQGKSRLLEAFDGAKAVYLGANKGGAAALRDDINALQPAKRARINAQSERATAALKEWIAKSVEKGLEGKALDDRLKELQSHLVSNLIRARDLLSGRGAPQAPVVDLPIAPLLVATGAEPDSEPMNEEKTEGL